MNQEIKAILLDIRTHLKHQKSMGNDYLPLKPPRGAIMTKPAEHGNKGKKELLDALRSEIGNCKRCRLHEGRTNLVFGTGNPGAELMFVGEGPGRDEDLQGIPFVGRAGKLLTKIIEAMGLGRDDVFIANVVKCLRYNAMVQLGNGKWERIGRLVSKNYKGTVKSIDLNGRIVNKKVTGCHATALGNRSVYKLSFKSARPAGRYKCAVYLTGDHPVLTKERGYMPVEKLSNNDKIATGQGLSPVIKNIITGMLLGDGHINSKESHLSFSHSVKQKNYALFKARLLKKELGSKINYNTVRAGHSKTYQIIKYYSSSKRSLRIIRNDFFDAKKKKVPEYLIKELNPMVLAIWFMDDGYMRIRKARRPLAEIATCAFTKSDLKILIVGLNNLGLTAYVKRNRIYFNVAETERLSSIIAPYVPKSMRYKLHPESRKKIPFNKKLYSVGEYQSVFYDKVEKKKIRYRGMDKTFYCIDVKDTNNFVTTGGVVHNCRPPENRNPAPDEIETCEPYLLKQIEIVGPKVVVCLGTFSAQLLLKTEEKISELRGKFFDFHGTKLMPTYHPAFCLRNPNMKRPVWEDMQKVMKVLGKIKNKK